MDNIFLLHCYPAEKKIGIIALHPNWSQVYNKILILLLHFQVIELSCRGKLSGSSCALGNSSYLQLGLKITTKQDRRKAIFYIVLGYCETNQQIQTTIFNISASSKLLSVWLLFQKFTFSLLFFPVFLNLSPSLLHPKWKWNAYESMSVYFCMFKKCLQTAFLY